jgi:hypothetical protein
LRAWHAIPGREKAKPAVLQLRRVMRHVTLVANIREKVGSWFASSDQQPLASPSTGNVREMPFRGKRLF